MKFNEKNIRISGTQESPLFAVKDICNLLGLTNTTTTIRNIPEKWKSIQKVKSSSGIQETSFVTEAGLYKIIMRSNKPISEPFQEFVCEEILPSIRKTGEYKLQLIIDEKNKLAEALKQVEDDKNKLTDTLSKVEDDKNKLTEENYDLHLLVKRKERKKHKTGSCVYIIKNPDIKDNYKIGESFDLNNRIMNYAVGAPKPYEVVHQRLVPTIQNQKSVEDLVLTIFNKYRVTGDTKYSKQREWVENIDEKTIKLELDGIVNYLNERRQVYEPDCNIYEEIEEEIEEEALTKDCVSCMCNLTLDRYYKRTENKDGLETLCKSCYVTRQLNARNKNFKTQTIINNDKKKCINCLNVLFLTNFDASSTTDGYAHICRVCLHKDVINVPSTDITEKKCSCCKQEKEINEFSKCSTSISGYFAYCRECNKVKNKQYRINKKKKIEEEPDMKIEVTDKKCVRCNKEQIISEYWKDKNSKDGHAGTCKSCKKRLRDAKKIKN